MKIYITSNIEIIKTWLIGGVIDCNGNFFKGTNEFNLHSYDSYFFSINHSIIPLDTIKAAITKIINTKGLAPLGRGKSLIYHGKHYKFKMPNYTQIEKLTNQLFNYYIEQLDIR